MSDTRQKKKVQPSTTSKHIVKTEEKLTLPVPSFLQEEQKQMEQNMEREAKELRTKLAAEHQRTADEAIEKWQRHAATMEQKFNLITAEKERTQREKEQEIRLLQSKLASELSTQTQQVNTIKEMQMQMDSLVVEKDDAESMMSLKDKTIEKTQEKLEVFIAEKENTEKEKSLNSYCIDTNPRGLAVIINIYRVAGYGELKGANIDLANMAELWDSLGFMVEVKENISAWKIQQYLESVAEREDIGKISCLALVLMSHGGQGHILGADGKELDLKEIFWKFSSDGCPQLRGKPKMLFIEACRGGRVNLVRAEGVRLERLPTHSDMLTAYASSPGYVSNIREETGSFFTESVCKIFKKYHQKLDVTRMLGMVINDVYKKGADEIQGPVWESTLRKELWL